MKNYLDIVKEFDNIREFTHQREILTHPYVLNPTKPVVLAFGTDGGKTFTTIMELIIYFSKPENKNKQVIIIPASKGDTRDNFKDALKSFDGLDQYFSFCVVDDESSDDLSLGQKVLESLENKCNVVVALPQTLASVVDKLPKVERIILDEAHEWYFANPKGKDGLVKRVITQTSPSQQLLLTGTPYDFNARRSEFDIFHYSVEKLQDNGKTGDAEMNIVSSTVDLDVFADFNDNGELRQHVKLSRNQIRRSVGKVFLDMEETLRLPGDIIKSNKVKRLQAVFGELEKTIVYFKRKSHAKHAYEYLKNITDVAISTGDDKDPTLQNFKYGTDVKVLIVVNKARQGFSDDELFNIVDFSFSRKPSMLQQMYGRLLRKSKLQPNKTKRYFKVAPKNDIHYYEMLMLGVMNLNLQAFYTEFEGKSDKLPVPRIKPTKPTEPNPNGPTDRGGSTKRLNMTVLSEMKEAGILLTMDSLKEINRKSNDLFSISAYTTLGEIRREIHGLRQQVNKGDLTKEVYDETIKKYQITHFKQLIKISSSLASKASKMGWDENLIKETKKVNITRTVESVTKFIKDNNIKIYRDFARNGLKYGQPNKKAYKKFLAEGIIEELVTKGKLGPKKGFTHSEEIKKQLSKTRSKLWKQGIYDNRDNSSNTRKDNFKLNK